MSNASPPLEEIGTSQPNPGRATTADKMLASLRRGTQMPVERLAGLGAAPAPAPAPVQREAGPEPKPEPKAETSKPKKASKKQGGSGSNADAAPKSTGPRMTPAEVQRNMDFNVSTGRGIKHLTIRVPKEMAADLALLAMRNKLSENGAPTTINELGIKAFESLLAA